MIENPLKIAVIDDNEAMADLLVDLLEDVACYEVVGHAYDGKSGIDLIQDKRPDVVVLDLCMPYIDGLGVMEAFQEDKANYFPKFVITTCVGQEHITSKAMKLGAAYYMIKPFDYEYFLGRLSALALEVREAAGSAPAAGSQAVYNTGHLSPEAADKAQINKISAFLQELGVPAHTKGYSYLKEAIQLVCEDARNMMKITKNLYPMVAERQDTTPSRVERSIRNAIELTMAQGNPEALERTFGHRVKPPNGRLTNSEFIAIIAEKIKAES